jgi:hypothetical protein
MLVMSRNLGEENEIFLKTFLLMMFFKKRPLIGNHHIGIMKSLSFSSDGIMPEWKDYYETMLENRDYESLKKIFPKAPSDAKADLEINSVRYSVKNSLRAKPAIINHTHRKGLLRVFKVLKKDITLLDDIIKEYWRKRMLGIIAEDTPILSKHSPFAEYKEYLKPVIEYFMFTGTAVRDSTFKADKILIFGEPEDTSSYKVFDKQEAFDFLWDKMVFSVRKKGMPKNYLDEKWNKALDPWVENIDGKDKGSLHVRV